MSEVGAAPLPTLLSWVWVAWTIEIDNAAETIAAPHIGRHFKVSLPMWTNALRFLDDGGITVDDLQARARAAVNLGGLERWGYLTAGDGEGRRNGFGTNRGLTGSTVLRPTRAGSYVRRTWPRVVAVVEEARAERLGAEVVTALERALAATLAADDGPSLPWSPPEIHPADGFRTEVGAAAGPGGDGDGDDPVPLLARVGQALTAATLAYEADADVSLPLAANLLRAVGDETVRQRDLPLRSGLSKEAVAMAVSWLVRHDLAEAGEGRTVALTATGRGALAGYRRRVAERDDPNLRAALTAVLDRRDALVTGLVPQDGCWRGTRPYRAQTDARLAHPTAALPWQPMVLHRGGWPDGA